MDDQATVYQTPEQRELTLKREALTYLESELAQQELELATLVAELQSFEQHYLQTVGARMAELDEIEAEIAELEAGRSPNDPDAWRQAEEARARAEESARATSHASAELDQFRPTAELKLLFRDVAKNIHPDLAADNAELPRRTNLMVQANAAYRRGDATALRRILDDWHTAPEAIRGAGIAVDLVRTIRQIAQAEKRLEDIASEVTAVELSDLNQLRVEVEDSQAGGYDPLEEMVWEMESRIARAARQRDKLRRKQEAHR